MRRREDGYLAEALRKSAERRGKKRGADQEAGDSERMSRTSGERRGVKRESEVDFSSGSKRAELSGPSGIRVGAEGDQGMPSAEAREGRG